MKNEMNDPAQRDGMPKRSESPFLRWYIAVLVGMLLLAVGLSVLAGADLLSTVVVGVLLGLMLWSRVVMVNNMP
jgi:hypothetical protein